MTQWSGKQSRNGYRRRQAREKSAKGSFLGEETLKASHEMIDTFLDVTHEKTVDSEKGIEVAFYTNNRYAMDIICPFLRGKDATVL